MTCEQYDNIAKCIRRRGTKTQREALKAMMSTQGWDQVHGGKVEIAYWKKRVDKLEEEIFFLRRQIKKSEQNMDCTGCVERIYMCDTCIRGGKFDRYKSEKVKND